MTLLQSATVFFNFYIKDIQKFLKAATTVATYKIQKYKNTGAVTVFLYCTPADIKQATFQIYPSIAKSTHDKWSGCVHGHVCANIYHIPRDKLFSSP